MRLLSLSIEDEYKSLSSFKYNFKSMDYDYDSMEPICFVGLNGSGKSNIIEGLSEIFCYLELYSLDYGAIWAKKAPFTFELIYSLKLKNKDIEVHLSATKGKKPKLQVDSKNIDTTDKDEIFQWLPDRIVGYTSGDNETISFPFMRNQGFYAKEILDMANKKNNKPFIRHTRTLFMDYEVNALILISNYLFSSKPKLEIFRKFLRIKDISSFRIKVALEKKGRRKVKITDELIEIINRLQSCALLSDYQEKEKTWIFDFILNEATRKAFKHYFLDAESLFTDLYKLNLLNAIRLTGSERAFYTAQPKKNALLEKPPVVPKEDRAFFIDQLKLNIEHPDREIDYVGISDGEHQFIHIIGTVMLFKESNVLYLFDEPESHFNPNWRSKFINILNRQIVCKQPEFVLSTHSPYVVSSCYSRNVLKFERQDDRIMYKQPPRETYGGTFETLLKELFGLTSSISEFSQEKLAEIIQAEDLDEMELAAAEFAESSEKRILYEVMMRLEEEQNKGK